MPAGSGKRARACVAWAALAAGLAFGGQLLTVQFNYGGNWTALFCTGDYFPVPPALAGEDIYVFRDSTGYDGQFYHYVAHDPFLQRGLAAHMDAPRLRCRRILIPGLAWLLSGGGGQYLHAAYIAVMLGFVFMGAYWLGRCLTDRGAHPAWSLAFLAIPGTLVSLDRLVIDGPAAALAAGFVLYARQGPAWKLHLLLAAAPLVRETGLLLTAGWVLFALWRGRRRDALVPAATALPALAWFAYVHWRVADTSPFLLTWPLAGLLQRLFTWPEYRLAGPILTLTTALDWLALAGAVLSLGLAAKALAGRWNEVSAALALFGLLFVVLKVYFFLDAYSLFRMVSPLAVLLLAGEWNFHWRWALLPSAMMLPRLGLQLIPQLPGVLRGLLG